MIKLEDMKEFELITEMHNDVDVYKDKEYLYFLRLNWDAKGYNILSKVKLSNDYTH